jgi:glycerol-3-phosphate acyltransferase PlsY
MPYLWCVLMGYLTGTLNPAYLTARLKGVDIKKKGSGNAGASNALILFGKAVGVLCALFDMAKAALIIRLALRLFPDTPHVFALTAAACILGHIFPFYMKFRGGKGLACLGGAILAYHPPAFAVMLTLEIVIVMVTKYICFVPITASVLFAILYGVLERDPVGGAVLAAVCVVIFCKHVENLRRIRAGSELRISYLWNRDGEIERLRDVYPDGKPR